MEKKQTLLFRVYQILCEYSDEEHPLTQLEIIKLLNDNYGLEVERKAIGRNISYLKEMGYEIHSDKKGSYLEEKAFENSELQLLIDSVLCSKHISANYSKQLIDKLIKFGGKYFKPNVKYVCSINDWSKTDNKEFFLNIELIDEAIERGKQVTFNYNKYGEDKKFYVTAKHTVSPYQMILHNQRYYLMSLNERWKNVGFYRMDKITDMLILEEPLTPIKSLNGYENGINYKELSVSRPYMFADMPERIVLKCFSYLIDEIIDWFGKDISIEKIDDVYIRITLMSSPRAMKYWALQYVEHVEVLYPKYLRSKIKTALEDSIKKYFIEI